MARCRDNFEVKLRKLRNEKLNKIFNVNYNLNVERKKIKFLILETFPQI